MKKSIHVCQLYSDIMSTYGDQGNLRYLEHFLAGQRIPTKIIRHTLGQPILEADIYLFGGGQDATQLLVAADLALENGQRLRRYLDQAYCLAICGGYQLLGKYYIDQNQKIIDGLDYLPIATVASKDRMVGHLIIKRRFGKIDRTIVGFENHSGKTQILDGSPALGKIVAGKGNNGQDGGEGIVYGRTIGTYLHGPVLPLNPHLAFWWLKDLILRYGQPLTAPVLVSERLAHRHYAKQIAKA